MPCTARRNVPRVVRTGKAHSEGPASGELRPETGPFVEVFVIYFKVRLSSIGSASSQFSLRWICTRTVLPLGADVNIV